MNRVQLSNYIRKVFETPSDDCSEWFGYYNYDTLNHNQTKMLCNRNNVPGVLPKKGIEIELGYYDINSKEWHHIGYSDSWNWMQGSMLQWLPSSDGEERVIYNKSVKNKIVSCIYDIKTHENRVINYPIYGITPDGRYSIALEMERSYWCRAYHYESVKNPEMDGNVIETDGIFEVDLIENTRKRLISIRDIINIDPEDDFHEKKHWLEHVMISPTGKRFCFLHRFSDPKDINHYKTRLFISNRDGSEMQMIPNWRVYDWSHFGWQSDDSFSIYTYTKYKYSNIPDLRWILKRPYKLKLLAKRVVLSLSVRLPYNIAKIINGKHTYYQLYRADMLDRFVLVDSFDCNSFRIDGHPSFVNGGEFMITDSYPDKNQIQHLYILNTKNHKIVEIAQFYANYHMKPSSCDLHPKLCGNNSYLVVDTAYNHFHHMIMFELDWDEIVKKIT